MSQDSPMQSGKAVIKVISKKHQTFQSQTSEKGRGVYPGLDTVSVYVECVNHSSNIIHI